MQGVETPGPASERNPSQEEKDRIVAPGIGASGKSSNISQRPGWAASASRWQPVPGKRQRRAIPQHPGQLMKRKLLMNENCQLARSAGSDADTWHRAFPNFSNQTKVRTFLKINKGVKSRPAGNPGAHRVFNHSACEHQSALEGHPGDWAS